MFRAGELDIFEKVLSRRLVVRCLHVKFVDPDLLRENELHIDE